jgi:uncharacterized protein (TIGR02145 family)
LITQNSEWQTKTSGAHSNYANNNANLIVYGSLYNWYAVHDIKGLCPTGWHVPTNEEWTTLINTLGGLEVAGGKLKESGLDHWTFPNAGADNSSDFGAIGAGFRDMNGTYTGLNQNVYFWSSSEYSLTHGISRKLYFDYPYVSFAGNYKQSGFSVRCIKD